MVALLGGAKRLECYIRSGVVVYVCEELGLLVEIGIGCRWHRGVAYWVCVGCKYNFSYLFINTTDVRILERMCVVICSV
jgi:hypothetical protein